MAARIGIGIITCNRKDVLAETLARVKANTTSPTLMSQAQAPAPAPAPAQPQQQRPDILVIMGDDVGWFNFGAYHRNIMAGMPRRAAPLDVPPSSPASCRSAPA